MIELRAKQQAQRATFNVAVLELDEIAACKALAFKLFGNMGVVEFDCDPRTNRRTGVYELGYFTEPPGSRPSPHRKRRILFKGASHRELVDQVIAWSSSGGNG